MKKKLVKGLIVCGIVFAALFFVRATYELLTGNRFGNGGDYKTQQGISQSITYDVNKGELKRNYASKRISQGKAVLPDSGQSEQKYEKVASIDSSSKDFEKDSVSLRTAISNFNAVVQYEYRSGLKGYRYWSFSIGVVPDKFDAFIDTLKKIGDVYNLRVDLYDQTSEFKNLNAERESLIKMRDSLLGLKNKSGSIEEFVELEVKILDIEQQIQEMGVKLGDFAQENEFSTIRVTMTEAFAITINIDFFGICVSSLRWSLELYTTLLVGLFMLSLGVLVVYLILEKLRWLPKAALNQTDKK